MGARDIAIVTDKPAEWHFGQSGGSLVFIMLTSPYYHLHIPKLYSFDFSSKNLIDWKFFATFSPTFGPFMFLHKSFIPNLTLMLPHSPHIVSTRVLDTCVESTKGNTDRHRKSSNTRKTNNGRVFHFSFQVVTHQ